MTIDLTQIILDVITLLGAILTRFVIPLIKSKLSVENVKITENQAYLLRLAIDTAVTAAEQIYNSDEGEKKKAYVIALLKQQGYNADTSAIDAAIEAAVLELHKELRNAD